MVDGKEMIGSTECPNRVDVSSALGVGQIRKHEVDDISGCNSAGRMRDLGSRCRTFEPCHSDVVKGTR